MGEIPLTSRVTPVTSGHYRQHKGYGTGKHMAAIRQHGPCPIHRRTFAPLKHMDLSRFPEPE